MEGEGQGRKREEGDKVMTRSYPHMAVCVCTCVRECVRECVHPCECARACVCAHVHVPENIYIPRIAQDNSMWTFSYRIPK